MPVVNGYADEKDFSSYIAAANNQQAADFTNRVNEVEDAITTASRMIDRHCGRVFYDIANSARVFAAGDPCNLPVPNDFHTITELATDSNGDGTFDTVWSASDYQLEPLNGIVDSMPGWPYDRVRAIGTRRFPTDTQARVRITANWGWEAVPDDVKRACLIQTHRLFVRPEAPFGVLGFGDSGSIARMRVDGDVADILGPYRRLERSIA